MTEKVNFSLLGFINKKNLDTLLLSDTNCKNFIKNTVIKFLVCYCFMRMPIY